MFSLLVAADLHVMCYEICIKQFPNEIATVIDQQKHFELNRIRKM